MEDKDTLIELLTSKVNDFTTEDGTFSNDLSEDASTLLSSDAKLDTFTGDNDLLLSLLI